MSSIFLKWALADISMKDFLKGNSTFYEFDLNPTMLTLFSGWIQISVLTINILFVIGTK